MSPNSALSLCSLPLQIKIPDIKKRNKSREEFKFHYYIGTKQGFYCVYQLNGNIRLLLNIILAKLCGT